MGIEPTAGGCPATGFEVQEAHQLPSYSHLPEKPFKQGCMAYCIRRIVKKQGAKTWNYFGDGS
jgi:hypothetical protein